MESPLSATPPLFVSSFSFFSSLLPYWGGAPASAAWPSSNRAYYLPFSIHFPYNVRRMYVMNGTSVSGSFDLGIYSSDGTKIWSSGSTSQTGTSTLQYVTPSPDILLPPNSYFFGIAMDNTTGHLFRIAPAQSNGRALAMTKQATAFPLPATMTPVALGEAGYYPVIGMTSTDSGF